MEPEPAEPPSAAVEVANGAEQTRVDKAPERRSPLSTEELMAIEDEAILDKMVRPDLAGWGLAGTGTSRRQVGNDRGLSAAGSDYGLPGAEAYSGCTT